MKSPWGTFVAKLRGSKSGKFGVIKDFQVYYCQGTRCYELIPKTMRAMVYTKEHYHALCGIHHPDDLLRLVDNLRKEGFNL